MGAHRRLSALVGLAVLVLAACSADAGDDGVARAIEAAADPDLGSDTAAEAFGSIGCDRLGNDRGDPLEHLAGVDQWISLRSPVAGLDVADAAVAGSVDVALPNVGEVKIFRSMLPGLRWALDHGIAAHIALVDGAATEEGRPFPTYVVVEHPDGMAFFAGGCASRTLMDPLRAAVGDGAQATIVALIGETDPDVLRPLVGLADA